MKNIILGGLILAALLFAIDYGLERLNLYSAYHPEKDICVPLKNKYC